MKLLTGLLAAMLLLACVGTSHAVVRIANDRGGQIGRYLERYEQLKASGQTIMIDGLCASSCTIVLGAIPHEKICVTRTLTSLSTQRGISEPADKPLRTREQPGCFIRCTHRRSGIGSLIAAV